MKVARLILALALAWLLCAPKSRADEFGNRAWGKSEYQSVISPNDEWQTLVRYQENSTGYGEIASGQEVWTKFDPLGLRDESDDEKEYVEKMTKLESDANKAGGKDDKAFAQNLGKSVKDYQKMISDVPDGAKDPVQLQAMNKALSTWVTPSASAKYAQSSAFFSGQTVNHCNEFVYDSFSAAGVPLVGSTGYAGLKSYAATANQYGDPKNNIKGTTVTGQVTYDAKNGNGDPKDASNYTQASGQQAKPGDIVAFPAQGGPGHVGISMGNHVYISATSSKAYDGDKQKNVVIKSDLAGEGVTIRQVDDPSKTP